MDGGFGYQEAFALQEDSTGDTLLETALFFSGTEPALPYAEAFTPSNTYNGCDLCVTLNTGCVNGGACQKFFLATGGSTVVSEADPVSQAGRFTASGSGLVLSEWTYAPNANPPLDQAVDGGACFTLASLGVDATWANDAGASADAGGGTDAGDGG
jgi:hypothetical protein